MSDIFILVLHVKSLLSSVLKLTLFVWTEAVNAFNPADVESYKFSRLAWPCCVEVCSYERSEEKTKLQSLPGRRVSPPGSKKPGTWGSRLPARQPQECNLRSRHLLGEVGNQRWRRSERKERGIEVYRGRKEGLRCSYGSTAALMGLDKQEPGGENRRLGARQFPQIGFKMGLKYCISFLFLQILTQMRYLTFKTCCSSK